MGTRCKGKFDLIAAHQTTKKDQDGHTHHTIVFVAVRRKNKNKRVIPRDYSSTTRQQRKAAFRAKKK